MIKRLHIQNFKSLRDVDVTLEPVTVLIGRSGTGKSNLVNGLRFLRAMVAGTHDAAAKKQGGWPALLCATKSPDDPLQFEVEFDVPRFPGTYAYSVSFACRGSAPSMLGGEGLKFDGNVLFGQKEGRWAIAPRVVPQPTAGKVVLGQVYGIPEAKVAHLALSGGLGCYDFPGTVLTGGGFDRQAGTSLQDSAKNYLAALDGIANSLATLDRMKDMVAAVQRINPSVSSIELAIDRSQVIVGHQAGKGGVISFPLSQESEGLRRFLAHLLAIYQQPPKQVLVFEEPEKGIYPGALALLAEHFQVAAARGDVQIILTTHSPQLLRHFKPEQIRVVVLSGHETKIGPLAPDQREAIEEELLHAGELLTVDEARILTPDADA